ncbi:MAG: ankyrin repeat domain-containing protein [Flavobacteriaceae bacterium]
MKSIKLILLLCVAFQVKAQDNVFLSRDFWAAKPSVAEINQKISEGNDPAEANPALFDGVTIAINSDAPNESIIHLIQQKGNDVNKLTHDGRTYIFWAAYRGNSDLMEYLLKNGARTNFLDNHGYSVLNFAANAGTKNTKVYDLCLANGANLKTDLNLEGANALLLAAPKDNDFEITKYFTSKGLSENSTDYKGNGIFNYVARTGNTQLMDKLLAKGIKGNDQAFLFASFGGGRGSANGLEVYKYLESKGLNPKNANQDGQTPLHIVAGRSKDLPVINYLLDKGLTVDTEDNNGNTPFTNAASRNSLEIVQLLANKTKQLNHANKKGQTALTNAVQFNTEEVVAFLIEKGAKTNVADASGNNLGYYLIEGFSPRSKDQFSTKFKLLNANKKINLFEPQGNGSTWYHLATEKNNLDLLKLADGTKVDINAKNTDGNTALILAAMKAQDDTILKYLLQQGANKSLTTEFGETAFDLAQENELLTKNKVSIDFLK